MRKYKVVMNNGWYFISKSRNSRKHLRNQGGYDCKVYTMKGKLVSWAKKDSNDKISLAYWTKSEGIFLDTWQS